MQPRIAGATLPGYIATVVDATNLPITDGLGYTWQCEAGRADGPTALVMIWTKTVGITSTATGFVVNWATLDMGALTGAGQGTTYLLEFTGTATAGVLKHRDSVTIKPQVA